MNLDLRLNRSSIDLIFLINRYLKIAYFYNRHLKIMYIQMFGIEGLESHDGDNLEPKAIAILNREVFCVQGIVVLSIFHVFL